MNLTPKQLKQMEMVARHADNAEVSTIENFIELHNKLDEQSEKLTILDDIKSAIQELPEPKDNTDQLQAILDKLNEPEVEDTIEVSLNII